MLASGMPVLGTRHCDIPEVIGPAFCAPLAPERDVVKLAESIQALLNAPDDWSDLASRGRKHVEENYHLDRQTERLIAHYNDVFLNQ